MENYEIIRQLGYGIFGKTFVAQNLITKEENVLKMICCKDETHANQVFREASKLFKVSHSYIGKLIETFVHFSEPEITFFLVIVMPFYVGNNCLFTLKENWAHNRRVGEELIKQWLVQMIELLSVLHTYRISHLNLKPENIFYDYEEDHVIVADFGFKTVLNDKRRYIRSKPNDFLWSFPLETIDDDLSKRDVWTLGMIFFALMSTSVITETLFFKMLQSTEKYDLTKLREIIDNLYSKELTDFIFEMIAPDQKLRPGIEELAAKPFFERCYQVYSSHVVSRQLRKKVTPNSKPIPIHGGPAAILDYICSEKNNELCVEEGLMKFQNICKYDIISKLPPDFAKMITDSMDINNINPSICEMVCCSLGYLAMYTTDPESMIFSRQIIQSVINALKVHPDNYSLHQFAAAYFIVLSSFHQSSILVGLLQGLKILVQSLDKFIDKVNVIAIVLNAIWNLCVESNNRILAIKYNALDILFKIYEKHLQSPVVLLNATASLLAIITSLDTSSNPDNIYITYYLMQTLQTHSGYVNLVKYTLVLLENLAAMNEEHAMQCIECVSKVPSETSPTISGLCVLKDIFEIHNDNSSMALCICNVLFRLVSYEDMVDVMLDLVMLSDLCQEIGTRFYNSKRVKECLVSINSKIIVQLSYLKNH